MPEEREQGNWTLREIEPEEAFGYQAQSLYTGERVLCVSPGKVARRKFDGEKGVQVDEASYYNRK